ncbi:MAG TPA: LIM domain-containing protein [Thermoanaerobaculia bacterium]|jgi:hypothetical protein|nr:LIM domain-containing protein [Thermoanaerobaculia bacterium]
MNDQEPLAAAGDSGGLQLDRAEFAENAPERCAACGQALGGSYYEVGGRICCTACHERLVAALAGRPGPAGFLVAAAAGLGAAAVGSAIFFAVRAATGYQFGLISILVGFLVGKAVHWGCGGRGGWPYQALAVLLTYLAIVSTYVPVLLDAIKQRQAAATATTAATADAGAGGAGAKAEAGPAPGSDQAVGAGSHAAAADGRAPARGAARQITPLRALANLAEVYAVLLLFASEVPFRGGVGILGLIIIAIGLYEAWKLNRRPRLAVSGPHTIVSQAWRR